MTADQWPYQIGTTVSHAVNLCLLILCVTKGFKFSQCAHYLARIFFSYFWHKVKPSTHIGGDEPQGMGPNNFSCFSCIWFDQGTRQTLKKKCSFWRFVKASGSHLSLETSWVKLWVTRTPQQLSLVLMVLWLYTNILYFDKTQLRNDYGTQRC